MAIKTLSNILDDVYIILQCRKNIADEFGLQLSADELEKIWMIIDLANIPVK